MSLAPEAARLLRQIESLGEPTIPTADPDAVRKAWRHRLAAPGIAVSEVQDLEVAGRPARLYRPGSRTGLLLYFHGGGWVLGDLDSHDDICRALATGSGHGVLSIDYRLAPEHPFPAALEDAVAAASWVGEHAADLGFDPGRLAIGGDSSGGNLAAVVGQRALVPWGSQLLIYPITDARPESLGPHDDGTLLTIADMERFVALYLSAGGSPRDPAVSPGLADDAALAQSPPTVVVVAGHDPLLQQGEEYARRLTAVGVPVALHRYHGMFHGFLSFAGRLDVGRRALDALGSELAAALD